MPFACSPACGAHLSWSLIPPRKLRLSTLQGDARIDRGCLPVIRAASQRYCRGAASYTGAPTRTARMMNARVERFNRPLREDFVEGDENLLWTSAAVQPATVGVRGWYNRERPHRSLGLHIPVAAMRQACVPESRISWRNTSAFHMGHLLV